MSNLFARLKIIIRIYLLIGIAALGIVGVVVVGATEIETSLTEARKEQTRRLVEVAYSLVANLEERAQKGEFTEKEGKERAAAVVEGLRYDTNEYFFILDWDGKMLAHLNAKLVGTNVLDMKDTNGKAIMADFIDIARLRPH